VLIEGDEGAEHLGRELPGQDGVRGAVPLESPVGNKPLLRTLCFHFGSGPAEGQRLGLGKDICHQEVMMPSQGVQ